MEMDSNYLAGKILKYCILICCICDLLSKHIYPYIITNSKPLLLWKVGVLTTPIGGGQARIIHGFAQGMGNAVWLLTMYIFGSCKMLLKLYTRVVN